MKRKAAKNIVRLINLRMLARIVRGAISLVARRRRRKKAEPLRQTVAKGLAAGLVGTAALTASSTIEQWLRRRPASTAPADAAAKLLHIEQFPSNEAKTRFSTAVHWIYGTAWGAVRALLGRTGLPPRAAAGAHLFTVWGSEQVVLPALHVAPPVTEWGAKEVAIDAFHHVVYETATSATFEALETRR